ncbi:MAG: hypothetical protein J6Z23_06410, partial [Lachnospiraceae bacterium]|nr:hypothetical protein [Lachnospiraceae bacterium]
TESTKVRLLAAKEGYPKGTVGVVVRLYRSGPACEVELWNESDDPVDAVTYLLCEVEPVSYTEFARSS